MIKENVVLLQETRSRGRDVQVLWRSMSRPQKESC